MKEPTYVQFVNRVYMFAKPLRNRTLLLTGPLKIGHIYLMNLSKKAYLLFQDIVKVMGHGLKKIETPPFLFLGISLLQSYNFPNLPTVKASPVEQLQGGIYVSF